jgi:Glycosyl transferase family 2
MPEDDAIRPALSVAIVCKNNAGTIGRTLESVKGIASEIIAVDSGSTDGTIELLEKHNALIIRSDWLGHVKTKQKAIEACSGDWVLCLDSDESLDDELRAWFLDGVPDLSRDFEPYHFWMRRVTWYNGRPLRYAWQPEWRVRLVWKRAFHWDGLDPHDQLVQEPGGRPQFDLALAARGTIRHDSIGTWAEFLAKQIQHSQTMARSLHAHGQTTTVWRLATSPVGAFLKQMVLKRAYQDGWAGWVAAASTALSTLAKHAMLLELMHRERAPGLEERK